MSVNVGIGIGADANSDGIITYADVGNYLVTVTRAQAEATGGALKIRPSPTGLVGIFIPAYLKGDHSTAKVTDAHANALGLTWIIDYHNYIANQAEQSVVNAEQSVVNALSEEQITALSSTNNNDPAALEVIAEQEETIQKIQDSQFSDEINQQIAELSKSNNSDFKKTQLTAEGSCEVIARGLENPYIQKYSYNTSYIEELTNIENFPTVVRFGNFVYCYYRYYHYSIIWMLIDIVPDPEVENQLGANIAYPVLRNRLPVTEIQYPAIEETIKATNTGNMPNTIFTDDAPYYLLNVENKVIDGAGYGYTMRGFWSSNRSYKEVALPKWFETRGKFGGFPIGNNTTVPWLFGRGSANYHHGVNSSVFLYGLFAPFATRTQFEKVYGKESDWVNSSYSTDHHMMFGPAANGTSYPIQFAYYKGSDPLPYPFTIEVMQPNSGNFRDIAGDNTGNGVDDSAIAKIKDNALATGVGLVSGVLATGILKKISNCGLNINTQV